MELLEGEDADLLYSFTVAPLVVDRRVSVLVMGGRFCQS